ncbi:hypothetical protein TIFTF001_015273 [Ficus carica]|uniref:Uncharacterized protein n=1 Tax=Ficus carica TaxID=3494 RepID=A0AA88A5I5_FICCA|nr:hypothetical protein TIFTF001_015273 [Ficus carica]
MDSSHKSRPSFTIFAAEDGFRGKRLEGGVAAVSGGKRVRERREWSYGHRRWEATEKGRGPRENGGEVGEKMERGVTAEEMGFEGELGEARVKEAQ